MILLTVNGGPLPSALLAGTPYDITVTLNGDTPISVAWSVLSGATVVLSGSGTPFRLVVPTPGAYTLHVKAIGSNGAGEEDIFPLPVSSRRPVAASLGVRWAKIQLSQGDTLAGTIVYNDPEGGHPRELAWTLFYNGNPLTTGTDAKFSVPSAQHGVYRLRATALDFGGATVTADSVARVSGGFEVRPAIDPPPTKSTLGYVGAVYSKNLSAQGGNALELPYLVASFLQDTVLPPGTTHMRFVLEGQVDDEVVVRTPLGNWATVGPPTGLTGEELPYDYSLNQPLIPAPIDRRLQYTLDLWNVHDATFDANAFRVKIECYSDSRVQFARFFPCSYSEFQGGAGERQRRLIAVVENLDVDLDAVYGQHRGGADSTVVYTTEIPTRIIATASAHGSPYPVLPLTGTGYTEANVTALYDPPSGTALPVLEAKGIYGISKLRPYTMSLSIPREVPVVQRVRRAFGRLVIYIAAGGVNAGTTITAKLHTVKAPGFVELDLGVTDDIYNPSENFFLKIGELNIDVSDYEFDLGGLAIDLTINE